MDPCAIDPQCFAPLPPLDSHVRGATSEWIFFWVNVAIFVGGCVWGLILTKRFKTWIPFMCMVGGCVTILLEPTIDDHLQVWWPIHHQPDILTAFGRDVPLMILFVVGWYFGIGAMIRWHWMTSKGPAAKLWTVYAVEVGMALALEPPAIQLDLWHYYGEHGLRIFGYPVWWPFVGGACSMAAGTIIYVLSDRLRGKNVWLVPVLIPMAVAAAYWACGWPMFLMLNTEPGKFLAYSVPFVSIGLAFVVVWLCTIATGHDQWRQEQKEAKEAGGVAEPAPADEPVAVG